jgi:membrane protein
MMRPAMFSLIRTIVRRARQERLAQVAGSLTFTTVLSIVPFVTVAFALFTRFPVFRRFEGAIEEHLLKGLLPSDMSSPVLRYLRQFADNASGLTLVGTLFLVVTAIAMLLTIENALNQIWAVKRPRPILRRMGLYVLMLAIGPTALGVSLWAMWYVLGMSVGLLGTVPPAAQFALTLGPVLLGALGLTMMFRFVPNAPVGWPGATLGGVFAAAVLELGKRAFAAYVLKFPTYKAVYGAFATLPVFLLWVYFSWLVVLAAALVAANLGRHSAKSAPRRRNQASR